MSSAHGVSSAATLSILDSHAIPRHDGKHEHARLDPESRHAALAPRRWREALAISLVPPLAMAYLTPDDPLLLAGHFPWFVLLPLLVGLQHGALAAALSSALLVGAGAIHGAFGGAVFGGAVPPSALASFAAACLAAGVVAGHFRDRTGARLVRLEGDARADAERLARLGRAHAVLKLSHQKLEQRLAAQRWSLVGAFEEARQMLSMQSSLVGSSEIVLRVLSNHALVQSATLLTLERDERGRVGFAAQARIGNPPRFDTAHPLVQRALDTGRLVALDADSADAGAEQDLLAVVPLGASSGRLLGLVLIHEMPFMAFQAENLRGLAAVTALLADMLEDRFVATHPDAALHLSLVPPEPAREALAAPASGTREKSALEADARPTEDWLEDELGEQEGEHETGDEEAMPGGEFVGSRTGKHRRRGVAQSA